MMGYGMARNVRQKIPKSSTLYVFDLDKAALERFVAETKNDGLVKVVSSAKEVVDNAVCYLIPMSLTVGYCHLYVT